MDYGKSFAPLLFVLGLSFAELNNAAFAADQWVPLNPEGHEGCQITGAFAKIVNDQTDTAQIRYLPYKIQVETSDFEKNILVNTYRYYTGDEYLDVALKMKFVTAEDISACLKATYPTSEITALPLTNGTVNFLPIMPDITLIQQSDGAVDLFTQSTWVGFSVMGKGLFSAIDRHKSTRIIGFILAGAAEWKFDVGLPEQVVVRSALEMDLDTEAKIMKLIKQRIYDPCCYRRG